MGQLLLYVFFCTRHSAGLLIVLKKILVREGERQGKAGERKDGRKKGKKQKGGP